jgi:hypothetical protein
MINGVNYFNLWFIAFLSQADIGTREIIDFSSCDAPKLLSEALARAIARRWEGMVLKGCDNP